MDIRKFVSKAGRVTFRDFMEHALYCPYDGYYGVGKVKIGGPNMDFVTHPVSTSPFFGRGIVRQINQMWIALGRPAKFDLVEIGGGYGVLARDILAESKKLYPKLFSSIKYLMIEISPALIKKQKRQLAHFKDDILPARGGVPACHRYAQALAGRSSSVRLGSRKSRQVRQGKRLFRDGSKIEYSQGSALDFDRPINGVIISNELLDSMPVHRLIFKGGKIHEIYVAYKDGHFVEELDELSNNDLLEYFTSLGMKLLSGQHLCINLDALRFLEKAAQNLRRGYIISIDYGDLAEILFGDDLSYVRVGKERQVGSYPYREVSEADITSDVDFTSLRRHGRGLGLTEILYLAEHEYFKYWLGDDLDKSQGVERAFEHFIGSNHKVLIHAKNVPIFKLKKLD